MIDEGGFWRHLLITDLVPPATVPRHRLDENERLLAPVARVYRRKYFPLLKSVVPTAPLPDDAGTWTNDGPYAVLHLCGKYSDKDVSQMVWNRLARHLTSTGLRLAFTGGGGEEEGKRIADVVRLLPKGSYRNFSGALSFGQTAELLRRAALYVGVDTSTTHVAAAVGVPVLALFGPTSACRWGPAPSAGSRNFANHVSLQRSKTVTILKNPDYDDCRQCRPGHKTRCPLSPDTSLARCLQTMSPEIVLAEVDRILAGRADASLPVSARTPDLSTKPD